MAFFASLLAYLATVGSIAFALAVSLCAFFSNPAPPAIAHRAAILAAKANPAHGSIKTASASSSSRKDLPVVHGSRAQHQRAIVEARRKAQMAKLRERKLVQEARQLAEPMGLTATAGRRSPRPELCAGPWGSVRRYLVRVDPAADLRPVATSAEPILSAFRSNFCPALLLNPIGPFISGEFRAHRRHSPDQSKNKLDHDPPDVL